MGKDRLIFLRSGPLEMVLVPRLGGSIARLDYLRGAEKSPILRGSDGMAENVLDTACFPLVPFCNRIRGGGFRFCGREIHISPNLPGDPSPLHGFGWLGPWDVVSAGSADAELKFVYESGEWPWPFEARQFFSLSATGVELRITCRNDSDEAMPCGLGFHPYFPCTSETEIDTDVKEVWTVDEHVLPVDVVPAEGKYSLKRRRICGQGLDNGYCGWEGLTRLETPTVPFVTGITSPDARFFQIYSPPSGGLIAAEPVGNANAALNAPEEEWEALGIKILGPSEETSFKAWIGLIGDHFSA